MKLAILYQSGEVFVEFSPEVFLELLKTYLDQYDGDIDRAFFQIQKELKEQTRLK